MTGRVFLALCVLLMAAVARAQDAVAVVGPEEVPREGYATWSLFLVCTPGWVASDRSEDLADLYGRFLGFGDAIGTDNVAVWFWKARASLDDAGLAENVDVARAAAYCKALSLRPSEGPYLVVTNEYPDLERFPRERAWFALGGLQPAELAGLLDTLTDQLLLEGRVAVARDEAAGVSIVETDAPVPDPGLWTRLLEGARRSLIGVGCTVRMQVSTGVLTAELRGCPP